MKTIDVSYLFEHYDALLIDAYGVLVDAEGVLSGAQAFVERLHRQQMPFCIVTNDASKLTERIAARFAGFHLDIDEKRIVSSAGLLRGHIEKNGWQGKTLAVIGPPDAHAFVERAGAKAIAPAELCARAGRTGAVPDLVAVVACDMTDAVFTELTCALNLAIRQIDAGVPFELVLCNPDIIYPSGEEFGLTSGALMLVLEHGLKSRYGSEQMPNIERLGKPFRRIFEEGHRRTGGKRLALLGDQLPTDVRGALDYGIDAVLVGTGLTKVRPGQALNPSPTFYLPAVGG